MKGDVSDRVGYDFEQLVNIAKVQVRQELSIGGHTVRRLITVTYSLQRFSTPLDLKYRRRPGVAQRDIEIDNCVLLLLIIVLRYARRSALIQPFRSHGM